ncbi:DMT family transporter [Telluribacter humicola]
MLGAVVCFGVVGAIAKWLSADFHTVQLVLFRNIVGVVFVGASVIKRPLNQKGGRLGLLIFRGVIGTLSLYLFFYAVQTLGLGAATTYQYTYPIFLALLSWLVVGETLTYREWAAIAVGLGGVLFVFRPDLTMPLRNHAIGLSNALLTSIAYLAIRQLSQYYDTRAIILSFMLSGIVMPIISMILGAYYPDTSFDFLLGTFHWPTSVVQWVALFALGLIAVGGQVFLTEAFTYDKAGRVAAIGYSNIVFSSILGLWLGDPFPDLPTIIGIVLIISGGVMVSLRK